MSVFATANYGTIANDQRIRGLVGNEAILQGKFLRQAGYIGGDKKLEMEVERGVNDMMTNKDTTVTQKLSYIRAMHGILKQKSKKGKKYLRALKKYKNLVVFDNGNKKREQLGNFRDLVSSVLGEKGLSGLVRAGITPEELLFAESGLLPKHGILRKLATLDQNISGLTGDVAANMYRYFGGYKRYNLQNTLQDLVQPSLVAGPDPMSILQGVANIANITNVATQSNAAVAGGDGGASNNQSNYDRISQLASGIRQDQLRGGLSAQNASRLGGSHPPSLYGDFLQRNYATEDQGEQYSARKRRESMQQREPSHLRNKRLLIGGKSKPNVPMFEGGQGSSGGGGGSGSDRNERQTSSEPSDTSVFRNRNVMGMPLREIMEEDYASEQPASSGAADLSQTAYFGGQRYSDKGSMRGRVRGNQKFGFITSEEVGSDMLDDARMEAGHLAQNEYDRDLAEINAQFYEEEKKDTLEQIRGITGVSDERGPLEENKYEKGTGKFAEGATELGKMIQQQRQWQTQFEGNLRGIDAIPLSIAGVNPMGFEDYSKYGYKVSPGFNDIGTSFLAFNNGRNIAQAFLQNNITDNEGLNNNEKHMNLIRLRNAGVVNEVLFHALERNELQRFYVDQVENYLTMVAQNPKDRTIIPVPQMQLRNFITDQDPLVQSAKAAKIPRAPIAAFYHQHFNDYSDGQPSRFNIIYLQRSGSFTKDVPKDYPTRLIVIRNMDNNAPEVVFADDPSKNSQDPFTYAPAIVSHEYLTTTNEWNQAVSIDYTFDPTTQQFAGGYAM